MHVGRFVSQKVVFHIIIIERAPHEWHYICMYECTVKLPIVDPPRKGHSIKNLSTVDSSR